MKNLAKGCEAIVEEGFIEKRVASFLSRFCFRWKGSGLETAQKVINEAEKFHNSALGSRTIHLAIILVVKNTFDIHRRKVIVDRLYRKKKFLEYLMKKVSNCLRNRLVTCGCLMSVMVFQVPSGTRLRSRVSNPPTTEKNSFTRLRGQLSQWRLQTRRRLS